MAEYKTWLKDGHSGCKRTLATAPAGRPLGTDENGIAWVSYTNGGMYTAPAPEPTDKLYSAAEIETAILDAMNSSGVPSLYDEPKIFTDFALARLSAKEKA